MIHLEEAGAHTRLESTLCAACPQGAAGCCLGPPDLGWSDIGRIVQLGGRDWLLGEIRAGNLAPGPSGLSIRRVRKKESELLPRRLKCVYHGPQGCTVAPDRRSATCNYYLCADAFADHRGDPAVPARARAVHATLRGLFTRWDAEIAALVPAVPVHDGGSAGSADSAGSAPKPPERDAWDEAFLDRLGQVFAALVARDGAATLV
jgi:hypothetical protein